MLKKVFNKRMSVKTRQLHNDIKIAFTDHPKATGETYLQHLWFTTRMSARFAYSWLAILIHGIFPFLCTRTASNQMEVVYRIMKTRVPVKSGSGTNEAAILPVRIPTHHGEPRVAIIGGGFSGAMVVANLVRKASGNLIIEWFEEGGELGNGVAYSTKDYSHLLNVKANRMGAFAEHPDGFFAWLQSEDGKKNAEVICPAQKISGDSFLPRALYAHYLKHIVEIAKKEAEDKKIKLRINHLRVTDAYIFDEQTQQIMLTAERGSIKQEILVDSVVLATGNLPPRNFHSQTGLVSEKINYIENVWRAHPASAFPNRIHELSADSNIVIIGTGLTMADTVLTMRSRGYKGTITAISRNGLITASHAYSKPYPAWEWVLAPQFAPKTAFGLLCRLRQEVRKAEGQGYDWRSVIDSIRSVTPALWQQLNTNEKRRFFSRLYTLWNIHRHRMSSDIFNKLRDLQQSGGLNIIAGKIYYVGSDKNGVTVAYRKRGTNRIDTLRPALALNCIGPEYDIAASNHTLLRNLRDRGLVTVGPLRIGIEITSYGAAKGKASEALFPVGNLLVGELLECTAVPELREQANETASKVLERIKNLYDDETQSNLSIGQYI